MIRADSHASHDGTETVELRITARPENVALARLALNGVAVAAGAPPDVVSDLKLAVSEVCTNAVQHAYKKSQEVEQHRHVTLRFVVGERQLLVEVGDEGSGFDPSDSGGHEGGGAGDRGESSNLGMGLTIARAVTDALEIESGLGGSRVVFLKRF